MGRGDDKRLGVLALFAVLGCRAGEGGGFDFGEGGSTGVIDPTLGGSSSGTDETTGGSESSDGGEDESTDGGSEDEGTTGEPPPTVQCTTLDILVVVDNSDTMAEEQAKLTQALPQFIASVQSQLPDVMGSIHVGVLATDSPLFVTATPAATCTPYASGANWLAAGETLATELACATSLGVAGDPDERPMQMTIEALSPEQLGTEGFHDGFLREAGPLVIVLVTDEEDDLEPETEWGSEGDPADWVTAIAASKGGWVQDVVVLSLVGHDKPNACPEYQWNGVDGAELAPRLIEFTESFPRHAVGDPCAMEYTTFLNAAAAQVVEACGNYVEP